MLSARNLDFTICCRNVSQKARLQHLGSRCRFRAESLSVVLDIAPEYSESCRQIPWPGVACSISRSRYDKLRQPPVSALSQQGLAECRSTRQFGSRNIGVGVLHIVTRFESFVLSMIGNKVAESVRTNRASCLTSIVSFRRYIWCHFQILWCHFQFRYIVILSALDRSTVVDLLVIHLRTSVLPRFTQTELPTSRKAGLTFTSRESH